ncbi:MAG: flavin reductase [Spirochaetota bacterium]
MTHFSLKDVEEMHKTFRLKLINSITGFKSANLLGTQSESGTTNLTVFSSITHLGSHPPFIGFVLRPTTVPRHSYRNIKETGVYTLNHINQQITDKAHYTSAKHADSEFTACGLTEEYLENFPAPYVKESKIKLGMSLQEEIPIKANGTILIVGKVEHIHIDRSCITPDGQVDLDKAESVAISGLNNYHKTKMVGSYPYARVGEFPKNNFENFQT